MAIAVLICTMPVRSVDVAMMFFLEGLRERRTWK
jgi:hypothetical protein